MANVPLKWSSLFNTPDREIVGAACFDMSNCSIRGSILEAEGGYSSQISSTGSGTVHGGWFARFNGVEEYGMVRGTRVYTASPTATAWTLISSGASDSLHTFQQYGAKVYAVCSAGMVKHTIGSTDWQNTASTPPASGDKLYPVEWYYRKPGDGGNIDYVVAVTDSFPSSGFWTYEREGGLSFTSAPTFSALVGTAWKFNLNTNYQQDPDGITFTGTVSGSAYIDMSKQDELFLTAGLLTANTDGTTFLFGASPGSQTTIALETSGGTLIHPDYSSDLLDTNTGTARIAYKRFYFTHNETARAAIKKIHITIWFYSEQGIGTSAKMQINLAVRDVFMNDQSSVVLTNNENISGAMKDTVKYRYSVTASGLTESALSNEFETSTIPSYSSCSMRVGFSIVSGSASGDVYNLYRKRKSDNEWARVDQYTYTGTGTGFTDTFQDGNIYFQDQYMEWELASLPTFSGLVVDQSSAPQAIGVYGSSLVLGIKTNAFISWVGRPEQFLDLDESPPLDINSQPVALSGKSVYVDQSASRDVNMVYGADVLWLGTESNTYVMFGGIPRDLTPPRAVSINGPIGPFSFSGAGRGVAVLNQEGVWGLQPSVLATDNVGTLLDEELTQQIGTSVSAFAPSSGSVLVEHRGDLWAFEGANYLKLDRKVGGWLEGTLNHSVSQALPDATLDMRLIATDGSLLTMDGGSTMGGSAIVWSYETGDIVVPAGRLKKVFVTCEGSPTLRVRAWEGSTLKGDKTYNLSSAQDHVHPFYAGEANGNRLRLTFAGPNATAKVKSVILELEGTDDRADR